MVLETVVSQDKTEALEVVELINSSEAADELGVTPRAITSFCKAGRIKGAFKVNPGKSNSAWLMPRDAWDAFKVEYLKEKGDSS